MRPRRASASSRSTSPATPRTSLTRRVRVDEVVALVGKVERRLEPRNQIEQDAIDRGDPRVSVPWS